MNEKEALLAALAASADKILKLSDDIRELQDLANDASIEMEEIADAIELLARKYG